MTPATEARYLSIGGVNTIRMNSDTTEWIRWRFVGDADWTPWHECLNGRLPDELRALLRDQGRCALNTTEGLALIEAELLMRAHA